MSNLDDKVNTADKPKRLEGKISNLMKTPMILPKDELPDAAKDVDKDKSVSSKVALSVSKDAQKKQVAEEEEYEDEVDYVEEEEDGEYEGEELEEGRGRPRKSVYDYMNQNEKRGRPVKSFKDGRGRPEKKKRGRPAIYRPEDENFEKRGRPPKSMSEEYDNDGESIEEDYEMPKKAGRPSQSYSVKTPMRSRSHSKILKKMLQRLKQHAGKNVKPSTLSKALGGHKNVPQLAWKLAIEHGHTIDIVRSDKARGNKVKYYSLKEDDETLQEVEPATTFVDMSEHVDALFEGENLTEEFRNKATLIFEAAVCSEISNIMEWASEAVIDTLEEDEAELVEEYEEKITDALTAIAEEFVEENQVAIQTNLRTEITEDFIFGLKKLFEDHYINIPEDKVDVVETLANNVAELEAQLNEALEKNIALIKVLNEQTSKDIVKDLAENLTDVDADKFQTLCEGITIDENYEDKVKTLYESYFQKSKPKVKKGSVDNENVLTEEEMLKESTVIPEKTIDNSDIRTMAYQTALARFSGPMRQKIENNK